MRSADFENRILSFYHLSRNMLLGSCETWILVTSTVNLFSISQLRNKVVPWTLNFLAIYYLIYPDHAEKRKLQK